MPSGLGKKDLSVLILLIRCRWLCWTGLSADGDSQGVERLFGALAAHMWPGMILKLGDKIAEPSLPEREGIFSTCV